MPARRVFLIPGFFGFASLGGLNYFQSVGQVLGEALARRRVEAEIIECRTKPTASIRRRADRLVEEVREKDGLDADELHFVGHSTGGLDVRLLTTPGVRLLPDNTELRIVERTRSVITVATPHFGTPLAGFFTTFLGRQLLEVLTVLATSWGGRLGLVGGAQLLGLVARADDFLGRDDTFLDFLARTILSHAIDTDDDGLWTYLKEIASDQGAVVQLMPEAMHLFNAAVTDHPAIRYSSVVTVAPPPPSGYGTDLLSLGRATLAGAFTLLHTLTAREHRHYQYPHPGEDVLEPYRDAIPFPLTHHSNDGIVPTFSQIYGRVLDVTVADHLDIVGQFARDDLPHGDWLPSGSGFDWGRFERVWEQVADEIAAAAGR